MPHFVLRDLFGWTLALALLAALSRSSPGSSARRRTVRARAGRHSSGMVFPVDVPDAEVMPGEGARPGGRIRRRQCVRAGRAGDVFPAVYRSQHANVAPRRGVDGGGARWSSWLAMTVWRSREARPMTTGMPSTDVTVGRLVVARRGRRRPDCPDFAARSGGPVRGSDRVGRVQGRRARARGSDVRRRATDRSRPIRRRSPAYAPIPRPSIPPLCAKCQSDADYMQQFYPRLRVDQYPRVPDQPARQADRQRRTRVAACSDCHRRTAYRGERPALAGGSGQRREDLREMSLGRGADGAVQRSGEIPDGVVQERPCGGVAPAQRQVRPDLQHVPRQPRRHAARR